MYTRPFRARKRAHSERAHRETQHHLTVIEDPEAIVGRPPSEAAWSAEDFAVARRGHLAPAAHPAAQHCRRSPASGRVRATQSSSTGGVGPSNNDFGGSNQDWVDAYNDQFNTPSTPTLPSSEGPKTTAQIVDDWYSNPYNATGITSVEQMRGRDAYNANPFDAYDPSGPDAFGSGNFKGLDDQFTSLKLHQLYLIAIIAHLLIRLME